MLEVLLKQSFKVINLTLTKAQLNRYKHWSYLSLYGIPHLTCQILLRATLLKTRKKNLCLKYDCLF